MAYFVVKLLRKRPRYFNIQFFIVPNFEMHTKKRQRDEALLAVYDRLSAWAVG